MALTEFRDIGISAISAAVPSRIINNYAYTDFFPEDEVKKVVDKIGILERRFADEKTTASDLCYAAAKKMFTDLQLDPEKVDVLLFVSQTPDYRMPATSVILQHRLGLKTSTIALDINLGCSAFVYALYVAYSMLQNNNIQNVLILNGETRSKVYSPKDRKTAFIFGDAGAAILVEKEKKFGSSFFSLNSDGSRESDIKMDAGGYRNPSSPEGFQEKVVDEYGNIRHAEHGYMDGENVFGFVAKEVPNDLKQLFRFANFDQAGIDYFLFHQASRVINNFLIKKLKLDPEKVPQSYQKFGNTSSVSIPLTIASELKEKVSHQKMLCLSAFGVGMSWASAIIRLDGCQVSEIVEI